MKAKEETTWPTLSLSTRRPNAPEGIFLLTNLSCLSPIPNEVGTFSVRKPSQTCFIIETINLSHTVPMTTETYHSTPATPGHFCTASLKRYYAKRTLNLLSQPPSYFTHFVVYFRYFVMLLSAPLLVLCLSFLHTVKYY